MLEEKKELWEARIFMSSVMLKIVVTHRNLKDIALKYSMTGPHEKLVFEYIIKEKGFDPSDLRSVEIKPLTLVHGDVL